MLLFHLRYNGREENVETWEAANQMIRFMLDWWTITVAKYQQRSDLLQSLESEPSRLQRQFSTLKVGPRFPWEPGSPREGFPGRMMWFLDDFRNL